MTAFVAPSCRIAMADSTLPQRCGREGEMILTAEPGFGIEFDKAAVARVAA